MHHRLQTADDVRVLYSSLVRLFAGSSLRWFVSSPRRHYYLLRRFYFTTLLVCSRNLFLVIVGAGAGDAAAPWSLRSCVDRRFTKLSVRSP